MSRKQPSIDASDAGRVLRAQREAQNEASSPEPTKVEGERPPLRNEPRREAMEEILRRDAETKAQDGLTPVEEEAKPVETPETSEPLAQEAVAEQTEPAVVAEPEMVTVKILGEEKTVPKSEVEEFGGLKAYQMAKASEIEMRQAREITAENKRFQENLARYLQQQMQPKEPQKTPQQVLLDNMPALQYGTPEQASEAWQKIQEATQPKVDPNQIIRSAVMQMQEQQALVQFRKDFPEIAVEPRLEKFATMLGVEKAQKMFREGKVPEWSSFYSDLGTEVRSLIGRPHQPTTQATTTGQTSPVSSAKEQRKASITPLPTSSQRAEVKKDETPETRDDILNDMRKKRGQPIG